MPFAIYSLPALLAAIACFAGFFVLDLLVKRGRTKAFDIRGITSLRLPDGTPRLGMGWAPVMRMLTQLGGPVLRYAIALPLAGWLYTQGYAPNALWLVAALASGWLIDGVVKKVFKRERPTVVPHLAQAGGPSFPSGHTLNASLVYCGLALACAPLLGAWLVPAVIGGVAISFAVAFSRVWLGVHWPTDIAAGWLLGTGWWTGAFALGGAMLGG